MCWSLAIEAKPIQDSGFFQVSMGATRTPCGVLFMLFVLVVAAPRFAFVCVHIVGLSPLFPRIFCPSILILLFL